jgi:hypothetical protein
VSDRLTVRVRGQAVPQSMPPEQEPEAVLSQGRLGLVRSRVSPDRGAQGKLRRRSVAHEGEERSAIERARPRPPAASTGATRAGSWLPDRDGPVSLLKTPSMPPPAPATAGRRSRSASPQSARKASTILSHTPHDRRCVGCSPRDADAREKAGGGRVRDTDRWPQDTAVVGHSRPAALCENRDDATARRPR